MRKLLVLISVGSVMGALAFGQGVRTATFRKGEPIAIRAKVRFSTLVQLPEKEQIQEIASGDADPKSGLWRIQGHRGGSMFYLHPSDKGLVTNVNVVTTNGEIYSFLLQEISCAGKARKPCQDSGEQPDLAVTVVKGAEEEESSSALLASNSPGFITLGQIEDYKKQVAEAKLDADRRVAEAQQQATAATDAFRKQFFGKLVFDYKFKSRRHAETFLLSIIAHDDRFTYIKLGAREAPAVFEIKDKKPSILNFDVEPGGVYIIRKVVDRGQLQIGKVKMHFERKGA